MNSDSNHSASLHAIALILITHPNPELRNAAEAVQLAERAAKITGHRNPMILETLAGTYAATGQFDRAVNEIQKAINLVPAASNDEFIKHLNRQLEMYKQRKLPEEFNQGTTHK